MANKKRLIDANSFINFFEKAKKIAEVIPGEMGNILRGLYDEVIEEIKKQPTVDAVEVVRCRDCVHYDNSEGIQWCHLNSKFAQWGTDWHSFPEDGFCSYGERKDNA
jgi:hypothetical protein